MSWTFRSFFMLLFVVLCSCTGQGPGSGKPQENADGSLGQKPRDFFRIESTKKVTIIRLLNDNTAKKLSFDGANGLRDLGSISLVNLRLSTGGDYLTLVNEPGIFEFREAAIETVANSGAVLPVSTLDSICVTKPNESAQFWGATFQELQIHIQNGGYRFVAISANASQILGGQSSVATKQSTGSSIEYAFPGQSAFSIYLQSPTEDSNYYHTSVPGLVCHLNTTSPSSLQVMSSTTATQFDGSGTWVASSRALTSDGNAAEYTMSANPEISDRLHLKGYFVGSGYALPGDATIEGVVVSCGLQGGNFLRVAEVSLVDKVDNFIIWGANRAPYSGGVPSLPVGDGISPDLGSSSDLWNLSLTPANINSPNFGVSLAFLHSIGSGTVGVDYCKLSVYWRALL